LEDQHHPADLPILVRREIAAFTHMGEVAQVDRRQYADGVATEPRGPATIVKLDWHVIVAVGLYGSVIPVLTLGRGTNREATAVDRHIGEDTSW
jgi:hypothetical protein